MHTSLIDLLNHDVVAAAKSLLGWRLVREIDGQHLEGVIVETEAYHQRDAASHSFKGQTARTAPMFGPAGHAYVYFTYGMHYCMNVVIGPIGEGSAVLIRALQPLAGQAHMSNYRHGVTGLQLTNGPAKLCQALAIDKQFSNHDLTSRPLYLLPSLQPPGDIVSTTRIGISRDTHRKWRFYIAGNPYVSKK